MRGLKQTAVALGLLPLMSAMPAAAQNNGELRDRVEQLERELSTLKQQLQTQNTEQQQKGVEIKKGTRFQYGGYIKADALFSDYSGGDRATAGIGDDFLVPSTIPVGGKDGDVVFDAHAKTSRLFFKTETGTDAGIVRTHIELDFMLSSQGDERISNSYASRVRHAYVAWDYDAKHSLLAGQSWTTFFNANALPELLDFVGPVGTLFERQTQVRWTAKTAGGGAWMLAAENPSTGLYGASGLTQGTAAFGGSNAYDNNSVPDLVARYDGKAGDFSYTAALLLREISYKDAFTSGATTVNGDDSEYGGAVTFAGIWQLGRDDLRFMLNYGNALGRYMGLQGFRDGVIKADGGIDLINELGGYIAYRHFWNERLRSTLVLSASTADNPGEVTAATAKAYQSVHANLLYSPVAALTLGGEYIYARKEIEGEINGEDSGELNRLQFSVKYAF